MSLAPGTRLGPYEIAEPIGAGGMGEVYRAADPRVGRDVAIKISADRFSDRFSREVHAVAALNHPNICTLYDVGPNYLVMELIDGVTLGERITQGPIPVDEALAIASKIASALEAAHDKGIVHRDLKPGNIKIKSDGTVKVLDFGLAKVTDPPVAASPEVSPTISMHATQAGMILGTAAYMSPEQARGKSVDKRADIWAFGVVLYEMVTGKRLFQGEDLTDTLASVVKDKPDLSIVPAKVRRLLERCLEKDPKKRLRDIGDMGLLLEEAPPTEETPQPAAPRSVFAIAAWIATGLIGAALAVIAFLHFNEKPPHPALPVRFQIQATENIAGYPFLSPDGRKVAFFTGGRVWVHFLESGESHELTASSGTPFWSADSRFIGFLSAGKIKRIAATGGAAQTVADAGGSWGAGAWNQDDVIVFGAVSAGLFRVPASGGTPVQLTTVDTARGEFGHYWPYFLPDGRHFVYIRASADSEKSAIYLGSVDAKPEQQSRKPLVLSDCGAEYSPSADPNTGYLLFMRQQTLMAQPFDQHRLELVGQPAPIAEQVYRSSRTGCFAAFSASNNDVLAFRRGEALGAQLTWYDRQGKVLGTVGALADYQQLALSPDGTRLAFSKATASSPNIWLMDLARDSTTRFTFGAEPEVNPVWSPDGSRIVFNSGNKLYQKLVSGIKEAEVLVDADNTATSFSRDGRFLLLNANQQKTKKDILLLPLEGGKEPIPFLVTEFNEYDAKFSPDGRWVAYVSNESGGSLGEVYVRSFRMNSAGTAVEASGKWQVSNGEGLNPRWRGDGRELYYRSYPGGQWMAVEIEISQPGSSPTFRPGKPQPLGFAIPRPVPWDSAVDGKRFLVAAPKGGSGAPEPYTVILNWQNLLKKYTMILSSQLR